MLRKLLVVFLIVAYARCFNVCNYKNRISEALKNLFDFVLEEPNLNFDGLFGIVHAKASIKSAFVESEDELDKENLVKLLRKASIVIETVCSTFPVQSYKTKIFKKYLLDPKLWERKINFTYGLLDYNNYLGENGDKFKNAYYLIRNSITNPFFENMSDECIMEVLEKTKNMQFQDCEISKVCNKYMTDSSKTYAYTTTHRLLFLQIARARNCSFEKNWLDETIQKYCSQIFLEANQASMLKLDDYFFDLLIEQIYLCGYEGFAEVMRKDWLDKILTSQKLEGCYSARGRFKRESNVIKYGCSDHTTGLVSAALSLFYYFLIKSEDC